MSDLADAVFGGQLLGHVIAGEELTASVVTDAAITADLASGLVVDNDLSPIEDQILQAKISQQVAVNGDYAIGDIVLDHFEAQLHGDTVNLV
jgi:hypothetical protein